MRLTVALPSICFLLTGFAVGGRQEAPRVQLGAATSSSTEEFTEVTALAELTPGRVLVGDARERRLVVIDFATSEARVISRIGSGPREFRAIGEQFFPRPGGGAWVVDFALSRLLPVASDGSVEDALLLGGQRSVLRATDAAGDLYGERMLFGPERQLSDTVLVLRFRPGATVLDTLLSVDVGRSGMIVRPGEAFRAFRASTSWTVLPDGRWVGLRSDSYTLSTRASDGTITAVALPFTAKPLTNADQERFRTLQAAERPVRIGQAGADPSGARPQMRYEFPAVFPAFDADAPLRLSPDGHLWIERLLGVDVRAREYDVIHPSGRIVKRVILPPRASVVGFGRGVVYVAVKDADDVLRLQRHPLP